MVMIFSLKFNTAPISCKVCKPIIRSYKGAVAPALYSTMSGVRCTDLLSEYSAKERVISPTFFVLKVPFEVPVLSGWLASDPLLDFGRER